ncbi:MAG: serine hydrolase [Gemmatimonadaceae bacterium]
MLKTFARFLALSVLASVTLQQPAHAQRPASSTRASGLQNLLDAELSRFPAKTGVWVKNLTTGEEASVRADDTFNTASVIKIPVLVLAMQMADKAQLNLSERYTITAADLRGGTGIFRLNDPGLQPTLRDVLMQMIITSDNTATDIAIAKVGGVERVNAWLKASGYGKEMKLGMTTGELFAKYATLAAGAISNDKTNNDRSFWLGEMTPRATGRMLESIQRCGDGSATAPFIAEKLSCVAMMRMLRGQQAGARRLPHYLNVAVAHKTGDFPPVLANDVGIIFARSGPIVVSFFANAIEGPFAEAEDRIGRIAQLIVEYFDSAK